MDSHPRRSRPSSHTLADQAVCAAYTGHQGGLCTTGKHWMQAVLRRNPAIRTQKCYHRDSSRVNGACTEAIRPWFNNSHLPEIQATKPENRYNMDEAGTMEGLWENGLAVGSAERRSIQNETPGSRVWTSFIECVSATGVALPPWSFSRASQSSNNGFRKTSDRLGTGNSPQQRTVGLQTRLRWSGSKRCSSQGPSHPTLWSEDC